MVLSAMSGSVSVALFATVIVSIALFATVIGVQVKITSASLSLCFLLIIELLKIF